MTDKKLVVTAVPVAMLDIIWPKCLPHIERVIDKAPDEINIDGVYKKLKNASTMLLVVAEGADIIAVNVLEVRTFDTGVRALYNSIIGAEGNRLNEWLQDVFDICVQVAKDLNCTQIRGLAVRPGWRRKFESIKGPRCEPVYEVVKWEIGEL